jgi:hypothetical protein
MSSNTNGRIGIRKNTGAVVGRRRSINLIEGSGITLTVTDQPITESLDVTVAASGGGGAPTSASYLVLGLNASLTAERVLTEGHGIDMVDSGANGSLTVSVDESELTYGSTAVLPCVGNDARLSDRRTANAIYETSGPTTLTVGAVADGQILKRVGSTVVGVSLALALSASAGVQVIEILNVVTSQFGAYTSAAGVVA